MTYPATANAQAVEALRDAAKLHKQHAAAHRKAGRDLMRRAAFLERLDALGITTDTQGDHSDRLD